MSVPYAIELSGTTEELYNPTSYGKTYRDYATMSFEDYTTIRREKGSQVEEDEFSWRWSMSQFRSQMAKRRTEIQFRSQMAKGRTEIPQDGIFHFEGLHNAH